MLKVKKERTQQQNVKKWKSYGGKVKRRIDRKLKQSKARSQDPESESAKK